MTVDARPRRWKLGRSSEEQANEHRLAFLDQTALELFHATGRNQLMQCVWVYEHPLDYEGLKRFHHNLYSSLASRLIERSPLPFGRPRWVKPVNAITPIQTSEGTRPRSELLEWADELGNLYIDPEHGPGCYLAVQPLDDGATAVSIVASHVIGDGGGGLLAIFEAVTGNIRNPGYDLPGARPLHRAVREDLERAVRDLPMTGRTLVHTIKTMAAKRSDFVRARAAAKRGSGNSTQVSMPSLALNVDIAQWDAKAESLGGNSYALFAGFAAKISEHYGRLRPADDKVTLVIAINLRESLDDDRALAISFANAAVDPTKVTHDLTEARTVVREARTKAKSEPDPIMELLPLMPWLPQRAVKSVIDLLFAYSDDLPASCSNLGDLPPQLAMIDGTAAEHVYIRGLDTSVTLEDLERSHGHLLVASGRINGKVTISLEAYQLGQENTKARLRDVVEKTLAEFGLTAFIE